MAPRITQISGLSAIGARADGTRIDGAGTGVVLNLIGESLNPAERQDNWPVDWVFKDKTYGHNLNPQGTRMVFEEFKFTFRSQDTEDEALGILTYLVKRIEEIHFVMAGITRESLDDVYDLPTLFGIMDRLGFAMGKKGGQKLFATFTLYIWVDFDELPDP